MNLRRKPDHNILGSLLTRSFEPHTAHSGARRRSEGGYSLVALLAVMTVLALFAMAVAPSLQQQSQRDKEKEAIYRGEQVAEAIREYYHYRRAVNNVRGDQALPTSMDQLVQGVPIPGGSKTRQILRASAARDPLSLEGEWRLIHPRSDELIDFQQAIMAYVGTVAPQPKDQQMIELQAVAAPPIVNVLNTGTPKRNSSSSSISDDSSGPFVGVASRSKRSSVLTFYGIESHDQWIFTPLFRN